MPLQVIHCLARTRVAGRRCLPPRGFLLLVNGAEAEVAFEMWKADSEFKEPEVFANDDLLLLNKKAVRTNTPLHGLR